MYKKKIHVTMWAWFISETHSIEVMLLPRVNAIHNSNGCFLCRNIGANLSHDSNQCNLFYVGALSTHVWSSNYHYSLWVSLENQKVISLLYQRGSYVIFTIGSITSMHSATDCSVVFKYSPMKYHRGKEDLFVLNPTGATTEKWILCITHSCF